MQWRVDWDDEEYEDGGCPDCRRDTVVDDFDTDSVICTNCGWRP